jgi:hypothetical protein
MDENWPAVDPGPKYAALAEPFARRMSETFVRKQVPAGS